MKILKLPKFHWAKLLSIFFFVILLGSYINIFAVGEPYAPGTMLDPSCGPTDPGCTVTIGGDTSPWLTSSSDIYYNTGNVGIGTATPTQKLDVAGNININTNGTNALFSTYQGANSDGDNIWIGGGGQNSIGEIGATYKGSSNTANGYQSLYSNTTGFSNTANGNLSLFFNTTGVANIANGYQSLYSNTTGNGNIANGYQSLYSNTTGGYNTANGFQSLYSNTTGTANTANGNASLLSNTTGYYNTANGLGSLTSNTTGYYNTANGNASLSSNTTGYQNTANGYDSGRYIANGSSANTTSNNSLYLGYDTRALVNGGTNEIVIGASAIGNGSNTTTLGTGNILYVGGTSIASGIVAHFFNNNGYCDINPTTASLVCSSDINLKKNITTIEEKEFSLQTVPDVSNFSTLEKLSYLTPVNYNWNSELDTDSKHIGFIAQEMEQVFPNLVSTDSKIDPVTGFYLKSISYTNLIPYTIEAIQEMNLKVKDLSSLDTESATSLGSLIKSFLVDQVVLIRELTVSKLNIDGEVCVDDVCINKEQFKQMIINASGVEDSSNTGTNNTGTGTPSVVIPPVVTPPTNNPAQALTPEEIEAQRLADLETERLAKEAEDKAIADKAEADRIEAERIAAELEAQNKAGEGVQ